MQTESGSSDGVRVEMLTPVSWRDARNNLRFHELSGASPPKAEAQNLARQLFSLFEKGEFFGGRTVGCFKRIGLWVFGWWVVYVLEELSKLAWSAAPQVAIEVTPTILVGLIIYLIAWIIDEGRMINEEQALTV